MKPKTPQRASLRVGISTFSPVDVDVDAGVIRNAAVMTIGPALGHGFSIDRTSLEQLVAAINTRGGSVKVRVTHPEVDESTGQQADDILTDVGTLSNVRMDGMCVRGDVTIEDYATAVPGLGDVRTYLLKRAASRPERFGLSAVIVFEYEPIEVGGVQQLFARISDCEAVDLVGCPAANPNGLLSAKKLNATTKETTMDEIEIADLIPLLIEEGLTEGASDEEAQKYFEALPEEKQAELKAKLEAAPADTVMASECADPVKPAAMRKGGNRARNAIISKNGDQINAEEMARVRQLRQMAETLRGVPESLVTLAIAEDDDVIKARSRFLAHLKKTCKPVDTQGSGVSISVGEDRKIASLRAAIPHAVMLRADVKVAKPHERAAQLKSLTLVDMGRHYLAALGVRDVWEMSRAKVAELMVNPRELPRYGANVAMLAQSTSDFSSILADTIGKSLRQAYLDAPSTWQRWARRATAPDFKTISRTSISESPGLVSRKEGGEIRYVSMSDGKETYTLVEYVGGLKLTRAAIINDDLDAFSRIPTLQANAARRKEDDVAYAILTDNAALSDTGLLFNSTAVSTAGGHANYTSSGTAISVDSLGVGRAALRKQKGPKGEAVLNLTPKYLIVPAAKESIAEQYTSSAFVAATSAAINPFATGGRSALEIVVEPRLDANSGTAWYLAADNSQIDTVEVGFLQEEPEPVLKQEVDFDTDDMKFAVRHTVAAKAIDFRGLYKNAGA